MKIRKVGTSSGGDTRNRRSGGDYAVSTLLRKTAQTSEKRRQSSEVYLLENRQPAICLKELQSTIGIVFPLPATRPDTNPQCSVPACPTDIHPNIQP